MGPVRRGIERSFGHVKAFQQTFHVDAGFAEFWYLKGKSLLQNKRCSEAEKAFDRALAAGMQTADVWYQKGCALYCERTPDSAERAAVAFRRAVSLQQDHVAEWYQLGIVLGGTLGAVDAFAHVVELDTGNVEGWHQLGLALAAQEQYEDALNALDKVLALNEANVPRPAK